MYIWDRTIYSEPGLGTTVRIYLPAALAEATTAPLPAEIDDTTRFRGVETVLVVEDDPFVSSYAAACLRSLGYRVVAAANGNEALQELANGCKPDILFTDIVMPGGVNGWELAERARQAQPALRVLLTSGYAIETLTANGRFPAGVVILNKPYRRAELARRLREALAAPRPVMERRSCSKGRSGLIGRR